MSRLAFLSISLFISASVWAGADVGWIEKIRGAPTAVQIIRDGKRIDATQFLPLQNGDQIYVETVATTVELSFANGKNLTIRQGQRETVTQSGEVPSVAGNLMSWIASLARSDKKKSNVVLASSRDTGEGTGLSIPLLKDDNTLIAGDREMALAWHGGKAPYELKLVQRETQKIGAHFKGLMHNRLLEKVSITPGIYELVVSDSVGDTWREKLIVVSETRLPEAPESLNVFPSHLKEILTALWLAGIDDGRWVLEAYTLIARQAHQEAPGVEAVMQAFEAGRVPGADQ